MCVCVAETGQEASESEIPRYYASDELEEVDDFVNGEE